MTVRFDDSLPRMVETIVAELGDEATSQGVILRDTSGRLAFFAAREVDSAAVERLTHRLREALGAYARTDRLVVVPSDPGARAILGETPSLRFPVAGRPIRLVDRRIVGADWLRPPAASAPPPPRFVFASLKGGVGRSTALAVVAAHLASRGRRVLAIDLDFEAPGLGAFLLDEDTTPPFGSIDVLVEENVTELDDAFFLDTIAPSSLAARAGRIDVLPAFGQRSLENPADVLAKLARAYAEDVRADGTVATILDKVRGMVDRFADPARYDAILVDVRAGLHETTASAVLGLGAEVFLFGLDEPQTFQGYAALLAHLDRFVVPTEPIPEWVERMTGVQAKAPADTDARDYFVQQWRSLVDKFGPGRSRASTTQPCQRSASMIRRGMRIRPTRRYCPLNHLFINQSPCSGTTITRPSIHVFAVTSSKRGSTARPLAPSLIVSKVPSELSHEHRQQRLSRDSGRHHHDSSRGSQ